MAPRTGRPPGTGKGLSVVGSLRLTEAEAEALVGRWGSVSAGLRQGLRLVLAGATETSQDETDKKDE